MPKTINKKIIGISVYFKNSTRVCSLKLRTFFDITDSPLNYIDISFLPVNLKKINSEITVMAVNIVDNAAAVP